MPRLWLGPISGLVNGRFLALFSHVRAITLVSIPLLIRVPVLLGPSSVLVTSFNLSHFLKGLFSNTVSWRVKDFDIWTLGGHNSVHNNCVANYLCHKMGHYKHPTSPFPILSSLLCPRVYYYPNLGYFFCFLIYILPPKYASLSQIGKFLFIF